MKKILVVIDSLGIGGSERALGYVLPTLNQQGLTCEVAALWEPYDFADALEAAGIVVHRLNIYGELNAPSAVLALAGLVKRGNYDVVQTNSFFAGFYVSMSAMLLPAVKIVVTFHDLNYESYPANNWKRRILKAMNRFLLRKFATSFVAISHAVAEHYHEHLGLRDIVVIPNAIPPEEFASVDREHVLTRYGVNANSCVLLMAARFVHEKGHRFLLEALAILKAEDVTPQALLFGNGPLQEEVRRLVRIHGLENQVTVSNAIPHDELLSLMQAADAFVLASTHEGFGLAAAEAMLMKKAVVATDAGGLSDLIVSNISGILVAPGDPIALAGALKCIIRDPRLRQSLGEAARERVVSSFSPEVVAPKWRHFYSSLQTRPATEKSI
jgi:glycosyltransferase involved in cell wall biosynthesis